MKTKHTIYQWLPPDERFLTQYGEITSREWVGREAARINRSNPRRLAEVISRGDGRINVDALPFWV